MITLVRYELLKTYRKLRTYIGFGLIAVLIPLVYWLLSLSGDGMIRGMTRGLQKDFVFYGNLFNGWFVAQMVMNALFVHIPFLIVLVAGDIFAGEATGGTFRLILTRPPSRSRIFFVKIASTVIYTQTLVLFLAVVSVILGIVVFGTGDVLAVQENGIAILSGSDIIWRFFLAYALAGWAMSVVAALAILFSTIVENAIGPIIGSMAVVILSLILGNLPFDQVEAIRPYLFTTYMDVWRGSFMDPVDWWKIARDSAYLGIFFVAFISAAWVVFRRKDILS